jgi:hypothetical protein
MKAKLITNSPTHWLQTLDCRKYAIRQAQSCEYLDVLFSDILSQYPTQKGLSLLLGYLNEVHKRQYSDIANVIAVPKAPNRKSFYFDAIYAGFNIDLLTILTIQGVSYLRGKDRYSLLKEYKHERNLPFINIWQKFHKDASTNAEKTFSYLNINFPNEFKTQLPKVLAKENEVIHNIWRHNKTKEVQSCDLS